MMVIYTVVVWMAVAQAISAVAAVQAQTHMSEPKSLSADWVAVVPSQDGDLCLSADGHLSMFRSKDSLRWLTRGTPVSRGALALAISEHGIAAISYLDSTVALYSTRPHTRQLARFVAGSIVRSLAFLNDTLLLSSDNGVEHVPPPYQHPGTALAMPVGTKFKQGANQTYAYDYKPLIYRIRALSPLLSVDTVDVSTEFASIRHISLSYSNKFMAILGVSNAFVNAFAVIDAKANRFVRTCVLPEVASEAHVSDSGTVYAISGQNVYRVDEGCRSRVIAMTGLPHHELPFTVGTAASVDSKRMLFAGRNGLLAACLESDSTLEPTNYVPLSFNLSPSLRRTEAGSVHVFFPSYSRALYEIHPERTVAAVSAFDPNCTLLNLTGSTRLADSTLVTNHGDSIQQIRTPGNSAICIQGRSIPTTLQTDNVGCRYGYARPYRRVVRSCEVPFEWKLIHTVPYNDTFNTVGWIRLESDTIVVGGSSLLHFADTSVTAAFISRIVNGVVASWRVYPQYRGFMTPVAVPDDSNSLYMLASRPVEVRNRAPDVLRVSRHTGDVDVLHRMPLGVFVEAIFFGHRALMFSYVSPMIYLLDMRRPGVIIDSIPWTSRSGISARPGALLDDSTLVIATSSRGPVALFHLPPRFRASDEVLRVADDGQPRRSSEELIVFSPNPSDGAQVLTAQGSFGHVNGASAIVYDMFGRRCLADVELQPEALRVRTESLAPGQYLLRLATSRGTMYHGLFIVTR